MYVKGVRSVPVSAGWCAKCNRQAKERVPGVLPHFAASNSLLAQNVMDRHAYGFFTDDIAPFRFRGTRRKFAGGDEFGPDEQFRSIQFHVCAIVGNATQPNHVSSASNCRIRNGGPCP